MINIGIIGIGGVGGYLAALVSSRYESDENVAVSLFARGETARKLKNDGIKLKSSEIGDEIVSHGFVCYECDEVAPVLDYLFVAVKSYSIDKIVDRLKRVVDDDTVIIPFQNGVDGRVKLVEYFPKNRVLDGCVYIMSKIEEPGVIVEKGIKGRTQFYYGDATGNNNGLEQLEELLSSSFDHIALVENISDRVWMKFSRISTISTIQTCYNIDSGVVRSTPKYRAEFVKLIEEFAAVALADGNRLSDDLLEQSIHYLDISPSEMTTSMQRDFYSGKRCELEGQTGYVVELARRYNIDAPTYEMMYNHICNLLNGSGVY